MFFRKLMLPLFCSLIALAVAPASAEILANDEFVVEGLLIGTTPSPGPGGVWQVNNQSSEGNNPITVSGGEVTLVQDDAVSGEDAHTDFNPQAATGTTYARFDFRLPASNGDLLDIGGQPLNVDGNYFALLRQSGNQGFHARTGVVQPSAAGDFGLAISADSSRLGTEGVTWPSDLMFDTNYRVVISYDAATGGSQLWLDAADETSDSIFDPTGVGGDVIQGFSFRQSGDYQGTQIVDNVVVATTFSEALNGPSAGLACDFDDDDICDITDIDALYAQLGTTDAAFDLDGNGSVDDDDIPVWLTEASAADALGRTFKTGDTNLNGVVGGDDFTTLALNFGALTATWGQGNFDGTGTDGGAVGGSDFTQLALNFGFTSVAAVPEPSSIVFALLWLSCLPFRRQSLA